MSSASSARKSVKIRRRGRHAAPSQVEQLAGKAVVAAPAVVIAGGVVMGGAGAANAATIPNSSASAPASAGSEAAAVAHTAVKDAGVITAAKVGKHAKPGKHAKATLDAVTSAGRTYDVKSGDTLASIARSVYGQVDNWHWIAEDNTSIISDPNLIFPGQDLKIPSSAPAVSAQSAPAPEASTPVSASDASTDSSTSSASSSSAQSSASTSSASGSAESGTLGCSGLEQLWESAGGNPGEAVMAASIAMAESGGNQYAVSPTDDYGYWQINASHGSMATFDPIGNAKAAISISGDGSNWSPWSTYTSGAYAGKC